MGTSMVTKAFGFLAVIGLIFSVDAFGASDEGGGNSLNGSAIESYRIRTLPEPVQRAVDSLTIKANNLKDTEVIEFLASFDSKALYLVPAELDAQNRSEPGVNGIYTPSPIIMNSAGTEVYFSQRAMKLDQSSLEVQVLVLMSGGKNQEWLRAKIRNYFYR